MRIWIRIVDEILQPFVVDITFTVSHRHNVLVKGEARARRFIEDAPDVVSRERRHGWIYGGYGSEVVRQAVDKHRKTLAQMDEELKHGLWLAGETFSLADIGVIPYINRLHMLNIDSIWQNRHPRVADWFERFRARDSFITGVEEHLPE